MRKLVRSTLVAGATGSLLVAVAWAGVGLAPVPTPPVLNADSGAPAPGTPAVPDPRNAVTAAA